jgi:hypothetical protein
LFTAENAEKAFAKNDPQMGTSKKMLELEDAFKMRGDLNMKFYDRVNRMMEIEEGEITDNNSWDPRHVCKIFFFFFFSLFINWGRSGVKAVFELAGGHLWV